MKKDNLDFIKDKKFKKKLWNPIGKAMHDYNMIQENDRIAVGISGGKDSITLLNSLVRVKEISNVNFTIIPIHIQTDMKEDSYNKIKEYCKDLGLELYIKKTDIKDIVFGKDNSNENNTKNPCFLCSRMRRGILYKIMQEENLNKLALGHHKDDIIETFLMNVIYQGNMNIMKARYFSQEYNVNIIRPLAYVEESDIEKYIEHYSLPIIKSNCPYDGDKNSIRKKVKNLIGLLSEEKTDVRSTIFNSIKNFKEI